MVDYNGVFFGGTVTMKIDYFHVLFGVLST